MRSEIEKLIGKLQVLALMVGPRPEYFIDAELKGCAGLNIHHLPALHGGVAIYKTTRATAPEAIHMVRCFAVHRRRFEMLHMATFFLN